MSGVTISDAVLSWYDVHRRDLPWRVPRGATADAYHVWLSEIMLQQTTVRAAIPYFLRFIRRWPTVCALSDAPRDDILKAWAGLGYYARARNLHACARMVVSRYSGSFPDTEVQLLELPGIGTYTAAAIAAIAFGRQAAVVDGNIERIGARLFAIATPKPGLKTVVREHIARETPAGRAGDFAQGLMDLGSTICTPRRPSCPVCPLNAVCAAHAGGQADALPVKSAPKARLPRHGIAYVVRDAHNRVLLRQRPEKGLLGGMSEVPTTAWVEDENAVIPSPPVSGEFRRLPGEVRHVFTHFDLRLRIEVSTLTAPPTPPGGWWVEVEALDGEALPRVMRKAIAYALSQ